MRISDVFKAVSWAGLGLSVILTVIGFEVGRLDAGLAFRTFGAAQAMFVAFLVAGGMYLLARGLETGWWRESSDDEEKETGR
jgi:uncharacterized membrane protein